MVTKVILTAAQIRQKRLNETRALVPATKAEQIFLWERFNDEVEWKDSIQELVELGNINGNPVTMHLQWVKLDGHLVCFYRSTSTVFHNNVADSWLREQFPHLFDSYKDWGLFSPMNFGQCVVDSVLADGPIRQTNPHNNLN